MPNARCAARWPAASPSKVKITSPVKKSESMMRRRSTLMWSSPNDVPQLATAFGQEGAGRRGVGTAQPFGVKISGGPVRVDQPAPLALFLARDVAALLVAEVDARPRGQPLDRLDEGQAVDGLHKLDDVATCRA